MLSRSFTGWHFLVRGLLLAAAEGRHRVPETVKLVSPAAKRRRCSAIANRNPRPGHKGAINNLIHS